jgi:hypothetical protein
LQKKKKEGEGKNQILKVYFITNTYIYLKKLFFWGPLYALGAKPPPPKYTVVPPENKLKVAWKMLGNV